MSARYLHEQPWNDKKWDNPVVSMRYVGRQPLPDLTFNVRPADIQKGRTFTDRGMTGSKPLEGQQKLAGGATNFGFNPCLSFIQQR